MGGGITLCNFKFFKYIFFLQNLSPPKNLTFPDIICLHKAFYKPFVRFDFITGKNGVDKSRVRYLSLVVPENPKDLSGILVIITTRSRTFYFIKFRDDNKFLITAHPYPHYFFLCLIQKVKNFSGLIIATASLATGEAKKPHVFHHGAINICLSCSLLLK